MNKYERALYRIDHTICMNNGEGNIKWNIDDVNEYQDKNYYDDNDTDCKSMEDFIECYDTLKELIDIMKRLVKNATHAEHPDPFFYDEIPEIIVMTSALVAKPEDEEEEQLNKDFQCLKELKKETEDEESREA